MFDNSVPRQKRQMQGRSIAIMVKTFFMVSGGFFLTSASLGNIFLRGTLNLLKCGNLKRRNGNLLTQTPVPEFITLCLLSAREATLTRNCLLNLCLSCFTYKTHLPEKGSFRAFFLRKFFAENRRRKNVGQEV